jgi:hypothetical protein
MAEAKPAATRLRTMSSLAVCPTRDVAARAAGAAARQARRAQRADQAT